MATEVLAVSEEYLQEVINVIRAGLKVTKVSSSTKYNLKKWCDEEEDYLKELNEEDEEEKIDNKKSRKKTKKSS